jgi:hypothetical protein
MQPVPRSIFSNFRRSNPQDCSSLVDHKVMLVSLAERSLLTPTVDGVLTVVVLSPERISPRSIDQLPTLPAGSRSPSSTPSSLAVHLSNFPTPLVLPSLSPFSSTHTAHQTSPPMSSLRSSTRTSTSDQV